MRQRSGNPPCVMRHFRQIIRYPCIKELVPDSHGIADSIDRFTYDLQALSARSRNDQLPRELAELGERGWIP